MKIALALAATALLAGCGGGSGSAPAAQDQGKASPMAPAAANGPDTSGLAEIILGKINEDATRQEQKATARLLDFKVVSVRTESMGDASSAVVECAGIVEFDAGAYWGLGAMQKAGEPAKFQCQAEYVNQGDGWQVFGPMGIYPL